MSKKAGVMKEADIYCLCRTAHGGRFMIMCDECQEWYHGTCVQISQAEANLIETYYCTICVSKNDKLQIVRKEPAPKGRPRKEKKDGEPLKIPEPPRCGDCIACFRKDDCGKCAGCEAKVFCEKKSCMNPPAVRPFKKSVRKKKIKEDSDEDEDIEMYATYPSSSVRERRENDLSPYRTRKRLMPRTHTEYLASIRRTPAEMMPHVPRIREIDDPFFCEDNIPKNALIDRRVDLRTLEQRTDDAKLAYELTHPQPEKRCLNPGCKRRINRNIDFCDSTCSMYYYVQSVPVPDGPGMMGYEQRQQTIRRILSVPHDGKNQLDTCKMCPKVSRPNSKYCSEECGERWGKEAMKQMGIGSYEDIMMQSNKAVEAKQKEFKKEVDAAFLGFQKEVDAAFLDVDKLRWAIQIQGERAVLMAKRAAIRKAQGLPEREWSIPSQHLSDADFEDIKEEPLSLKDEPISPTLINKEWLQQQQLLAAQRRIKDEVPDH